jgi:hypothetical protein
MLADGIISANTVGMALLILADFVDMPLAGALAAQPISVPLALPDAGDAAGQQFVPLNTDLLQISPVGTGSGGTESFVFSMMADPANPEMIDAVNDPAIYAGRDITLWLCTIDAAGTATGIEAIFAGAMNQPSEQIGAEGWTLTMICESYLALLSGPPSRTYLIQELFDPGDLSARATLAVGSNAPMQRGGGGRGLVGAVFGRLPER